MHAMHAAAAAAAIIFPTMASASAPEGRRPERRRLRPSRARSATVSALFVASTVVGNEGAAAPHTNRFPPTTSLAGYERSSADATRATADAWRRRIRPPPGLYCQGLDVKCVINLRGGTQESSVARTGAATAIDQHVFPPPPPPPPPPLPHSTADDLPRTTWQQTPPQSVELQQVGQSPYKWSDGSNIPPPPPLPMELERVARPPLPPPLPPQQPREELRDTTTTCRKIDHYPAPPPLPPILPPPPPIVSTGTTMRPEYPSSDSQARRNFDPRWNRNDGNIDDCQPHQDEPMGKWNDQRENVEDRTNRESDGMSASPSDLRREMEPQQGEEPREVHVIEQGGNPLEEVDLHSDENETGTSKRSMTARRRTTFLGGLFGRNKSDERRESDAGTKAEDKKRLKDDSRFDADGPINRTEKPDDVIDSFVPPPDLPLARGDLPYAQKRQLDERLGEQHWNQYEAQYRRSDFPHYPDESLPPPPPPPPKQNYLNTPRDESVDTRPSLVDYTRKISTMYFATAEDPDQIYGSDSDEEGMSSSDENGADDGVGTEDTKRKTEGIACSPQISAVDVDVLRDLVREELRKIVVDGPVISHGNSNEPETTKQVARDDFPEVDSTFESDYVDDDILSALEDISENCDDGYFGNENEALVAQHDGLHGEAREEQSPCTLHGGNIFPDEPENEEDSVYEYEFEYETYDDADYSELKTKMVGDMDRMKAELEERVRLEVAQKEAELQAKYLEDKEKEIERVRAEEAEKMAKRIEVERAEAEQIAREKTTNAERIKQKRITAKRLKKERAKFEEALAAKDKEMELQRSKVVNTRRKAKDTFLTRYSPEQIAQMSEEELDRIIGPKDEE